MRDESVPDWQSVPERIDEIVRLSIEPFDKSTVQNAHDFVAACRNRCSVPDVVTKGYWSTISLSWPKIEVEIFPDRFELYHFVGNTDITEFNRSLNDPVPEQFLIELVSLVMGKR